MTAIGVCAVLIENIMPIELEPNQTNELSLIVLGFNYTLAVTRWLAEGRPIRSLDEIQRIYEEICSPCLYFNAERQTCRKCGCRTTKNGSPLVNKIAMQTEICPLNKWT